MRSGVAFVVNPASGRGRGARVWAQIEPAAREHGIVEAAFTTHARHGEELARQFASEGWGRIVAVGGDGTLNEVLQGVMRSDSIIGVIPLGTGNDWVRTVGIPHHPRKALEVVFSGKPMWTDVGEAEGHGFFLNVMGAGFDAEVARRIAEAKGLLAKLGPTPRYVASVFGAFGGYKAPLIQAVVDGARIDIPSALLVAVGVAQYYGSGMHVLPDARIDDGLLDMAWGSGIRFHELPGLLSKIFKGRHGEHKKVQFLRGARIELSSSGLVPFHIDGDPRGHLPVKIAILPRAIRVTVP